MVESKMKKYVSIIIYILLSLIAITVTYQSIINYKNMSLSKKFGEELNLKFKEIKDSNVKSVVICVQNIFQANQCILCSSYIHSDELLYNKLTDMGVSLKISKQILKKDLFLEGIAIFVIKDEKIIYSGRIYNVELANMVMMSNIKSNIKFLLTREYDTEIKKESIMASRLTLRKVE